MSCFLSSLEVGRQLEATREPEANQTERAFWLNTLPRKVRGPETQHTVRGLCLERGQIPLYYNSEDEDEAGGAAESSALWGRK